MLRTVFTRFLPGLSRLSVCHYSAAAIPAPSAQPEVHYNKVKHELSCLAEKTLVTGEVRNDQQVWLQCKCSLLLTSS